jgi:hypothetical protein
VIIPSLSSANHYRKALRKFLILSGCLVVGSFFNAFKIPTPADQSSSKPLFATWKAARCVHNRIGLKQVKTEEDEEGGGVERHPE